ncbi:MAG: hypothetical protein ACKO61_05655, partial [Actinomycetota bacterium]
LNNLLTGKCAGTTMRGWNAPPGGVTVYTTSSTSTTSTTTATSTTRAVTVTTVASAQGGSSGSSSGTGDTSLAPIKGNPGSFCSPEGALGLYNSLVYVCSKTDAKGNVYAGNRARWRRQT